MGDDHGAFFALDEAFHRGLMALAGHEMSWGFVAAAKGHLDRARMLGLQNYPGVGRFVAEHRAIFAAVDGGDLTAARDELRSHLRTVFGDIEAIRDTSPELFAGDPESAPVRRSVAVWQ